MSLQIQFLGGAGTVTGSKYLVKDGGTQILVDCGLFQGVKSLRLRNWNPFPLDAAKIDAIILTHAHIDHSGYIPRLIKEGFRGKIYSTLATKEVCDILLPDCGYLQEEEAEYLNRKKRTKHNPAVALFMEKEAEDAMKFFVTIPFNEVHQLTSSLSFEFLYAGHILGAASVILSARGKKIAFSGDVGRLVDPIFYPPATLPQVDYLVVESTYGNRLHPAVDPIEELGRILKEAYQRQGVIVIPAFAVGRAQSLMHALSVLRQSGRIPAMPMYLNSPMATDFSHVFEKHHKLHRLSDEDCRSMNYIVRFVNSVEESKALNERKGPMLIISASGMLTGGRVLHHLKAFAPFEQNTIILSGFQSAGTRGEALQRGATEIKIHGEYVPVRARVVTLDNMSAHADYSEIIQWLKAADITPKKVFITHGESSAADELRRRLTEQFGWNCVVPELGESVELEV